jgi:phage antirepressor YoqD-like protein
MNSLITIQGVRAFIDKDGTAQLHQEDVARGLGFVERKGEVEYIRWGRLNGYMAEFGFATSGENEFIPENIFYLLAMKANNETAIAFQKKVACEILPSIRKHGMYAKDELLDNPDLLIEVATKLKEERQARLIAENKIKELTPAADLGNAMRNNDGLIIIRDFVKVLANVGIKIRQCDLFSWLVKKEYLYQNKRGDYKPRVEYVHSGLFKVAETPVETRTNGSFISYTTRLTAKGQEYFINKLKGEFPCRLQ